MLKNVFWIIAGLCATAACTALIVIVSSYVKLWGSVFWGSIIVAIWLCLMGLIYLEWEEYCK